MIKYGHLLSSIFLGGCYDWKMVFGMPRFQVSDFLWLKWSQVSLLRNLWQTWDFKSYNAKKPIWDVHILPRWMPGCLQTKRIILLSKGPGPLWAPAGEGTLGRTQEGLLGEDPPPRVILVTWAFFGRGGFWSKPSKPDSWCCFGANMANN